MRVKGTKNSNAIRYAKGFSLYACANKISALCTKKSNGVYVRSEWPFICICVHFSMSASLWVSMALRWWLMMLCNVRNVFDSELILILQFCILYLEGCMWKINRWEKGIHGWEVWRVYDKRIEITMDWSWNKMYKWKMNTKMIGKTIVRKQQRTKCVRKKLERC